MFYYLAAMTWFLYCMGTHPEYQVSYRLQQQFKYLIQAPSFNAGNSCARIKRSIW